jgi:oxygen-independent coproporphyrinogen-3 oxidase
VIGLYLHIPFCSSVCSYCNFNRGLFDAGLKGRYVSALELEIREAGLRDQRESAGVRDPEASVASGSRKSLADTIFFGGGTPSLLEPEEIARLIAACRDAFDLDPAVEVTLETNPETSSPARMERFRAAGVNRISFGVQSFREAELRRLGRVHTADRASAAVNEARGAGFDNISLDLMMWLPQQSRDDWQESVEALIALEPDHASLYLLELYPNAPLKEDMARAGWSLAPEDDAAEMYLWSLGRLDEAGYRQYEISNVARSDRESRHNLKYWTDGEWLGFGCGAHSTRDGVRWRNVAGTEDYIRRVTAGMSPVVETRRLSRDERLEEALFTGLRLAVGVDIAAAGCRYGVDVWARFGPGLTPFVEAGLLRREGPTLRLTRDGMLVANEIMAVFV